MAARKSTSAAAALRAAKKAHAAEGKAISKLAKACKVKAPRKRKAKAKKSE